MRTNGLSGADGGSARWSGPKVGVSNAELERMMLREEMLRKIRERAAAGLPWDIAVIGGGATGVGVAVDAAARGYRVVLLEQSDFGKGTSSRSTKLIHGGLRYLQQGRIHLVREALRERALLCTNAPHLVHP